MLVKLCGPLFNDCGLRIKNSVEPRIRFGAIAKIILTPDSWLLTTSIIIYFWGQTCH